MTLKEKRRPAKAVLCTTLFFSHGMPPLFERQRTFRAPCASAERCRSGRSEQGAPEEGGRGLNIRNNLNSAKAPSGENQRRLDLAATCRVAALACAQPAVRPAAAAAAMLPARLLYAIFTGDDVLLSSEPLVRAHRDAAGSFATCRMPSKEAARSKIICPCFCENPSVQGFPLCLTDKLRYPGVLVLGERCSPCLTPSAWMREPQRSSIPCNTVKYLKPSILMQLVCKLHGLICEHLPQWNVLFSGLENKYAFRYTPIVQGSLL